MTHQEATHRRSERQGVPDPEGGQLALPLDLADHHRRPLCSMGRDPRTGYWTGSYRRPPVEAWADWRHVEHNTETSIVGIFLDVDEPGAVHVAADDSLVPWPSWVMTRLGNGHQAACWLLENPVHTYPGSREKPRQLLRRTAEYFASTCDADPAYAGTLFRNVGLASRESGFVVEGTDRQWPLLELAESIPFGWRVPSRKKLRTAVGRNVSLFELLMREAGREHVADDRIRMLAWGANEAFDWPLGSLEVACTVRSVLRYRAQWREAGWHDPRFRTRQAARGQAGREGQRPPPPLEGREGRSDGSGSPGRGDDAEGDRRRTRLHDADGAELSDKPETKPTQDRARDCGKLGAEPPTGEGARKGGEGERPVRGRPETARRQ